MKMSDNMTSRLLAAALAVAVSCTPGIVWSQATAPTAAAATPLELTAGEVRKIDKSTLTVTLKHGEIRNLDMPAMTMVFKARDARMLDTLKPGDKVRFRAEKVKDDLVLTVLEVAG